MKLSLLVAVQQLTARANGLSECAANEKRKGLSMNESYHATCNSQLLPVQHTPKAADFLSSRVIAFGRDKA